MKLFTFVSLSSLTSILSSITHAPDEPGGGDKSSDEKRKEQSTPVVSPSQGSPEAKEERYFFIYSLTVLLTDLSFA